MAKSELSVAAVPRGRDQKGTAAQETFKKGGGEREATERGARAGKRVPVGGGHCINQKLRASHRTECTQEEKTVIEEFFGVEQGTGAP